MEVDKMKTSEFIVQSLSGVIIGLLPLETGFVYAWPSCNVANFASNETVLGTPMTTLQISLVGSLPSLGGLISTPLYGWAFDTFGRKYGSILSGLPYAISWLIISLTNNITWILLAMALSGAGAAGQNVSTIYLTEIAHVSIRGGLTSIASTATVIGLLLGYAMGGQFAYMTSIIINLTVAVVTMALLACLPESPVYLVMVGKEKEAAKSISFYRRLDVNSKQVETDIINIRRTINPKIETLLQEKNEDGKTAESLIDNIEMNDEKENLSAWKFLMKSKSSKRILVIILIMTALAMLTGGIVLQIYAEPLFAEAVPSMSANQCAIFLALDSFIASLVCMVMVDKFGRKSMMMASTIASAICTGLLGLQLQLDWAASWITSTLIYIYGFVLTTGCGAIPFILASEVFLPEVRSICNTFCYSFVWIFNFIILMIFPPIVESMGLGPIFYIFCFMSFATTAYVQFYLKETKGLTVDKIQLLFLKESDIRRT